MTMIDELKYSRHFQAGQEQLEAMFSPTVDETLPLIDFSTASHSMRAALLWSDAMRVIGGKSAFYVSDPSPWTKGLEWSLFKKDLRHYGCSSELLSEWAKQSMEEDDASAFALSRCGWVYKKNTVYLEEQGYYIPSEGSLIEVFALDCPTEPLTPRLPFHFIYSKEVQESFTAEGVVMSMGMGEATARHSMIKAWNQMARFGLKYDLKIQRKFTKNRDPHTSGAMPLHEFVFEIIPELKALKETLILAASMEKIDMTNVKPLPPKKISL